MAARLKFETRLWKEGFDRVMGLDEAGRGCLCGPVVAAGVILKPESSIEGVRDSKMIKFDEREKLASEIKEKALFWTVQKCTAEEIDCHNILQASLLAMRKCAEAEGANPNYLLIDGNRYLSSLTPYTCLVKGDNRSASIGAASILAKVSRDRWMKKLHQRYPHYGWDTNVGYPTASHFEGLKKFGLTRYHRKSFNLGTDKVLEQE